MTPATTFIYALSDPQSGEIRYIGKSDRPKTRLRMHLVSSNDRTHRGYWISSLLKQGLKPELKVLEEISFDRWPEVECGYIRMAKLIGMNLVNGNEGGTGYYERSVETREKMRASQLGKKHSAETRAKISALQKGRKSSLETRARQSAALKGRKHSLATRAKISATRKARGLKPSLECRKKAHDANTGRVLSEERRKRIGDANRGGKRSIEARARMSAAAIRRYQKGKEL